MKPNIIPKRIFMIKEAVLEEYRLIIAQNLDTYFLSLKERQLKVDNSVKGI